MVYSGIFPGESVDVLVVELRMLLELVVVVDPAMVVLVEYRGQRDVRCEIDYSALVAFGSQFYWRSVLHGLVHFGPMDLGRQVRRFSARGVEAFDEVLCIVLIRSIRSDKVSLCANKY